MIYYIIYIVTTVYSSFLLVDNRDIYEDRRTADAISVKSRSKPFPNYQQPMACFVCIDHDNVKWREKVSSLHYKTYFGKKLSLVYYIRQVDNILPLSVQLEIHGTRHNVVRTSVTNSPRRLVHHFFVLTTL